jgi:hypothetical protein
MVYYARLREKERKCEKDSEDLGENFNKSPFGWFMWWMVITFSIITLTAVLYGIIEGQAGE